MTEKFDDLLRAELRRPHVLQTPAFDIAQELILEEERQYKETFDSPANVAFRQMLTHAALALTQASIQTEQHYLIARDGAPGMIQAERWRVPDATGWQLKSRLLNPLHQSEGAELYLFLRQDGLSVAHGAQIVGRDAAKLWMKGREADTFLRHHNLDAVDGKLLYSPRNPHAAWYTRVKPPQECSSQQEGIFDIDNTPCLGHKVYDSWNEHSEITYTSYTQILARAVASRLRNET